MALKVLINTENSLSIPPVIKNASGVNDLCSKFKILQLFSLFFPCFLLILFILSLSFSDGFDRIIVKECYLTTASKLPGSYVRSGLIWKISLKFLTCEVLMVPVLVLLSHHRLLLLTFRQYLLALRCLTVKNRPFLYDTVCSIVYGLEYPH